MGVLGQLSPQLNSLGEVALWLLFAIAATIPLFYILRRSDLPFSRAFWLVATYVLAFGAVQLLDTAFYWGENSISPLAKALIALVAWGLALVLVSLLPRIMQRQTVDNLQQAEERRKQAEAALQASEDFYESLIGSLPINVFRKDKSGSIVYANARYCETLGHDLEDLLGKTDHDLFPQDLADKYVEDDAKIINTGGSLEAIERHRRPDGEEIIVQVLKAPVHARDGSIVGVQGMFWDVTSREKAEEAHRESEARLKAIMDNTAAVIYLKDDQCRYRMINRRYEQLFNVNSDDVLGKTDFDIWPQELAEAFQANDRQVLQSGEIVECEEIAAHSDGNRTYLSVKFPLRNSQGEIYAVAGISTDITERKRAENALRESEERRNLALEAAQIGTWTWSIGDDAMLWDERLHAVFGLRPGEFDGSIEDFFSRVHADDRAVVRNSVRGALEEREDFDVDFRILRPDGEVRSLVARAAVVRTKKHKPLRMTGVCLDVTERERAEQALREVQERMRRVVEAAHDAFIAIDAQGSIIEWNREAERTFGWPSAEAIGSSLCELIVPEKDRANARDGIGNYLEGGKGPYLNRRFETEALRRDGTIFPIEMTITPVRVEDSYVFSAFLHDITSRRQAEEALRRSDARFRRLVDSNIVGITIDHFDGSIMEANDAFLRMVGYTRADLKAGKLNWERMTPSEHQESTWAAIETLRSAGTCTVREKEYFRADGTRVPVLVGVTMLEESGDKCICVIVDITERKKALSELQTAKEQADAANEAKSRFLANMSHEIRTPMNAIIGLTELVLDTRLEGNQRDYLQMVQTSAESLLAIINDVLDYSKIEAGRLEINHGDFRIRELVGDVLKTLAVRAHERNLELAFDAHQDVPEFVLGDAGRLRQVLTNLVGNAIKFTESGEVVVSVELESRHDDEVLLQFVVSDTGIGIAEEHLESIFEAFEQVDTSTTRRFAGTGLGLAITQRIVRLMGGRIWAESEVGHGSSFHFTCKLGVDEGHTQTMRQPEQSLHGLTVLVVDDNDTNRHILAEQLQVWGMHPTVVSGAEAALQELLQAAEAGTPFAFALVDGNMPNVDGFQLVEQLQQSPAKDKTRILMLTSGGRPDDLERCQRLGILRYLTKPVKQSELLDSVCGAMGVSGAFTSKLAVDATEEPGIVTSEEPGDSDANVVRLRILLAEDSLVNQKLAVGLLNKKGHHVTVASNGREALAALERDKFDVILMDVQMPELDGLETTATIRKLEADSGERIPIIAMTAHAMQGDRQRCLDAGMDDYIAKPIRSKVLYETLVQWGGGDEATETQDEGNWMKSSERLDWQTAWETVGGDLELLRELVAAFLEEFPLLEQKLMAAVGASDAENTRIAAHTIKGSMRYFGAKTAYDLAYKLESAAGNGRMADAGELAKALREELAAISPLLRRFIQDSTDVGDFPQRKP